MKTVLGVESDAELARALNIPRSTVSNWVARETMPYEICVEFVLLRKIRLEWLILGYDPQIASESGTEQLGLSQENAQLRAENERLRQELAAGRAQVETKLEFWQFLETIARTGPITEEALAVRLQVSIDVAKSHCRTLFRRGVIYYTEGGWAVVDGAILRADRDDEASALIERVRADMEYRILPGARDNTGAVAMADVRIEGDMPGVQVMNAMHSALGNLEGAKGALLRVVIGVAPLSEND